MSNEKVFESRDIVNKTIVDNLREYGDIEPPALYGRHYNAGTRTKYQFSAANYLRIAAAQREYSYPDIRWLSEQAIADKKFTVKANAKPVKIEYWEGIDNGQSYEGNLRKFYNAADIAELDGTKKNVYGNEETDVEYALDILHANGIDMDENFNSNNEIFSTVKEYASKNGADEFAAPLTSQLFFKTSHLSYDYGQYPLYTEEQINKLAENPKILFHAMKKAQEIVKSMQMSQERELKNMADKIQNEWDQPFKDLSIDFFWSERCLKDLQGKEYQDGQHLQGETAYQFLVQLNAADKEQFNSKLQGFGNYDKTKLSIRYGNYDHGEMRIDLGDLELSNKTLISDALVVRFNEYRHYLMTNDQAMDSHISFQKSQGEEVTREQVIAECEKENAQCEKAMQQFAKEEKQYLEKYPEIKRLNEQKADVFLYYCKEQDFSNVPNNMVLTRHKAEEYDGIVFEQQDPGRALVSTESKFAKPEPNDIVFESAISNDEIKGNIPVKAAFSIESQVAMENLEKFSIKIENYGTVMEPFEFPTTQVYKGKQAVQRFIYEKNYEVDAVRSMNYEQKIIRHPQQQMTFLYDGKEFYKLKYEIGSGTLNQAIPSGLPIYNEEKNAINKELQQAVYTHMKYQGIYRENGIHDLNQRNEIRLPDINIVRSKVMENKPDLRTINSKQFAYYAELATLDFKTDTPVKVMKAMIQEMKQDGLSNQKIANIIKTNRHFDVTMLTNQDSLSKVKKRKLQVDERKGNSKNCEMSM
ncbi:hypothetical protein NXG27_13290 [Megasphaera paucivorans]|uniref:Uncharacterized protein n=1 Tax=Megasphaera paucivorans TaxID=349095 RepID=A0A1G9U9L5_9FIRM|nr:hypothetical protein [Megasphaera paucivorans]SDM56513.1 hypothetical protein SAMN05660299_01118 [Megasphaera paucivorans]